MAGDSRKDFVLATIGNHFGYSVSDGAMSHIASSRELDSFLDDGSCLVLATHAELVQDVKLIQIYNQLDVETTTDNWLVFFKLSPSVITPDNLHSNILVSSLLDSPLDTLYHTLQKVYAPVLLRDERWSKTVDPKIQSLLGDLEAGLGSALRRFGKVGVEVAVSSQSVTDEALRLSTILCPSDEFQFWAEAVLSGTKLAHRERAQRFQELFQPITARYANLDALSFSEALELIEITQDTLDDVWKETDFDPPYPERRMIHLLQILSDAFGRFVQRKLNGCDFWTGLFSRVRTALQDGLMVCDKWSSATEALTVQFWKQYSLHRWKGGAFVSPSLSELTRRLEEVSGTLSHTVYDTSSSKTQNI